MSQYTFYVAIAGGILMFLVFAYLIYYLSIHRKVLIESITSFELIKHKDWKDQNTREEVKKIQSNKRLV